MKSDERTIQAISAKAQSEAADNRLLRNKLRDRESRVSELESMVQDLTKQLGEKMDQLSDLMNKMVSFMMGNGDVALSGSLRDTITEGIRAEYEARERAIRKDMDDLKAAYDAKLAAKENEIDALRHEHGNDDHPSTSVPASSSQDTAMSPEAKLKSSEQQKANLQVTAYGQRTESGKYHHGDQQTESGDGMDIEGTDVPDEKVVEIACKLKARKCMLGIPKPRREQPLFESAKGTENDITLIPEGMPDEVECVGEDVSVRYSFVKGYIRTTIIRRRKYKDSQGIYYHVNLPEKYNNCMGRTQVTESVIVQVLIMHFHYGMTLSDIEDWLKKMGLNYSHSTVIGWMELAADILEPLDSPLQKEIIGDGNMHSDETTLGCRDKRLPGKGENEEDVEDDLHFFKRWLFCHHSPELKLSQFIFHERGRRTQDAIRDYLKDVTDKLYLHSDGAPLYKCYDIGELIMRVACMVHMRRPFYKLKDVSDDAKAVLRIFDEIFHKDKNIKDRFKDAAIIKKERILQILPLLNDLKSYLDKLQQHLEKEEEPELLKAVNYALKEYPCIVRCLEDGRLDLSNNCCERQIRKIAKYRNNSFFVCSPASGVRFARLMSFFANIKQNNLDPVEYLTDVFRRIKTMAKDEWVNLLAHKWRPYVALNWG